MATENVFSGLKVVDLASFIAGPGAATMLSDFGADVIKVEPPGSGDPHRNTYRMPPLPSAKDNYAWHLANRNKRGMALDLKSPRARVVLERLVNWADVLVVNFPPPVRKRLKLTYEDVAPWNSRLIYADITGYGDHGPDADLPGFRQSTHEPGARQRRSCNGGRVVWGNRDRPVPPGAHRKRRLCDDIASRGRCLVCRNVDSGCAMQREVLPAA